MVLEIRFSHLGARAFTIERDKEYLYCILVLKRRKKRKLGFEGFKKIKVWYTCMEPICMDTCLGLCMESMDLLVRKPS